MDQYKVYFENIDGHEWESVIVSFSVQEAWDEAVRVASEYDCSFQLRNSAGHIINSDELHAHYKGRVVAK